MRIFPLLCVSVLIPASVLPAQSAAAPKSTRSRNSASAANACAELAATPSALVSAPEGMALLRLKRELESAALTLEQQPLFAGGDARQIMQVQRGVDSLLQVFVRYVQSDTIVGGDGSIITMRRTDSVRVIGGGRNGEARMMFTMTDSGSTRMAPQMQATIRSLQPRISAFIAAAEAQSGRRSGDVGYLGIGLLGAQVRIVSPDGVLVSHCDYPVVETVDSGSPASRAGVLSGDTLVAYNGRDVKQFAVNYQMMLVPGEQVRVRLRRGRTTKEVPITVGMRDDDRQVVVMRRADSTNALTGRTSGRFMITTTPGAPGTPMSVAVQTPGSGVGTVLGADVSNIEPEFAQSLGLEAGVLVLRVPTGSMAALSGLRGGEVIRAVNGVEVRDVPSLRRVLASGSLADTRLLVWSRAGGTREERVRLK